VYFLPKKDMSWIGLPEFADDTITDYTSPSPSVESNLNDLQNSSSSASENEKLTESTSDDRNPSVTKTEASLSNIVSKPFIKFVKATDSSTENKADKVKTVRKTTVKYAELYRKTSKKSNGNSQNHIDDKGYWDSGCSRHMTGNISYISDHETFDEGYVSFGQGGCKITGKGTIKTDKLEFKNVYFVKDLKYNLFSVSQICDNKNSVLFTDSECIVLVRDFKLIDDTNVLLRTPRQHNMYSIDLNNIVTHKDLTCLVAKASIDEYNLGKFKAKGDKGYFIGYFMSSKALRVQILLTFQVQRSCSADAPDSSGNSNPTATSTNPLTDHVERLAVETLIPTISSLNVWSLVDCPKGVRPIGIKWVLKNKKNKRGIVIRNKARLVAQGHTQEEGIDYDEVFAPIARIEAIRLFLAYASFIGFTVFQMDVKSAFLYGTINEEVYKKDGIFLSQDKYVGDILKKFGYLDVRSANTSMEKENPWGKDKTGKDVDLHLYRSMIGSLMYLIASRPDIMFAVCACAKHQVTPKECHLHEVKRIFRYLKGHPKLGL
nr:hypothetical protein [Tanacetum cinerariifolium]